MRNLFYSTNFKQLFVFILFLLPCLSYSQNIVLNVTGKVLVNGQPVKKGDNLNNGDGTPMQLEGDEAGFRGLKRVSDEKMTYNMDAISNSFQNNPDKSFVSIVKDALSDKIVDDNEVTFEKNKMAFKSASATHTAVPVFIKVKHSS